MTVNRLDWDDIKLQELQALHCTELHACVELVESGQLTKEDALIRAAYRLSIFREDALNKITKAIEHNDIRKLI